MSEPIIMTKQIIEQVFDDTAKSYDSVGPGIYSQFGSHLIEKMPLVAGAHVLDVATGKGAVLLPAARRVGFQGHIIGIDISRGILQEAERVVDAYGLTNVELRKMDAECLEFPDQTFDFVTCAFALFLFPDMEAALREMYRVCKPGGFVGVTFFSNTQPMFHPVFPILVQQLMAYQIGVHMPHPLVYAPEEVEAALSKPGFGSTRTYVEANEIIYEKLEDLWTFLLSLPIRAPIMSMNEETRARFKDEYFAKLRPMIYEEGLHISVAIVYAMAKR